MATYTKEKDIETILEDDSEARKAMQEVFLILQGGQRVLEVFLQTL